MKTTRKAAILIVLCAALWLAGWPAHAQEEEPAEGGFYLLEPNIPQLYGENATEGQIPDLATYLNNIFKFGIGVATGLAVIYIAVGGAMMMVTGSITKKEGGREMIQNAIWGLVLALGGVLILQTINPKILEFQFIARLEELTKELGERSETEAGGGEVRPPPDDPADDARVRGELAAEGVGAEPACPNNNNQCANLDGLPDLALNGLGELQNNCGCEVYITGGTEPGGHQTHGPGNPIVDLRVTDSLLTYLRANASRTYSDGVGFVYEVGNDSYRYEADQTQQHFHVCYGQQCR